jgi:hypothetical protein
LKLKSFRARSIDYAGRLIVIPVHNECSVPAPNLANSLVLAQEIFVCTVYCQTPSSFERLAALNEGHSHRLTELR